MEQTNLVLIFTNMLSNVKHIGWGTLQISTLLKPYMAPIVDMEVLIAWNEKHQG